MTIGGIDVYHADIPIIYVEPPERIVPTDDVSPICGNNMGGGCERNGVLISTNTKDSEQRQKGVVDVEWIRVGYEVQEDGLSRRWRLSKHEAAKYEGRQRNLEMTHRLSGT